MNNALVHKRWTLRVFALLSAALMLCLMPFSNSANAHGSTINPASRNYQCYRDWGNDHLNPSMAQQDPMCWQAWQANPNAMWNWNGLYQNNVGGNHQGKVPNGTLCSGGHAESGRYDALDTPGAWRTTSVGSSFTVQLYDQASHGADYFQVYVTRQGFNPDTERLGWDDLQLVTTTGRYGPSQNYSIPVSGVTGRSGHHVVFTVWQASHMDQVYYLCSDVRF
ncbi:lytic polysaccharide monooxygenase [Streptomyces sp. B6B3]|jgi:predicted carbohydrate-binding protein with CBM5 and CBM33 domain|uniref:lytic polysaccharide monooxygenase auxiliary activity family 9 protein n=1 Tax=Streptomyces sp. B6B3 TaxID=3153570 RepID=UPI00325ED52A